MTAFAAALITSGYSSSRPELGVLLRVVQPRERAAIRQRQPLEIEQDGRSDQRAGERAPSGLVGPGYEAPFERAIEGE